MSEIKGILERAIAGQDISIEEGIALLKVESKTDREAVRLAADTLRLMVPSKSRST